MRCFHPKLKVDLGRGPGKGIGPRLFVGLASATPLPLTACQASKLGVEQSFDVDLNPAQVRRGGCQRVMPLIYFLGLLRSLYPTNPVCALSCCC